MIWLLWVNWLTRRRVCGFILYNKTIIHQFRTTKYDWALTYGAWARALNATVHIHGQQIFPWFIYVCINIQARVISLGQKMVSHNPYPINNVLIRSKRWSGKNILGHSLGGAESGRDRAVSVLTYAVLTGSLSRYRVIKQN